MLGDVSLGTRLTEGRRPATGLDLSANGVTDSHRNIPRLFAS